MLIAACAFLAAATISLLSTLHDNVRSGVGFTVGAALLMAAGARFALNGNFSSDPDHESHQPDDGHARD